MVLVSLPGTELNTGLQSYNRIISLLTLAALALLLALPSRAQTVDDFNPGAGNSVSAFAVQPDGRILVGGVFTQLAGQTRNYLGRLSADGSLDAVFNPGANATVYSLALQPDGRILVGGDFTTLAGGTRRFIGRLNTNGTADSTFNTTAFSGSITRAQAILVQPDGKIIVGGRTSFIIPPNHQGVGGYVLRLNTNGTTDSGFTVSGGVNGPVCAMALQPDGKILLGGLFSSAGGQTRLGIARLNTNGVVDTTFNPGSDGSVFSLAVEADGNILVGGTFGAIGGQARTNLARVDSVGNVDATFDPRARGGANPVVYSLALQADHKILVSGLFSSLAGGTRNNIGRLNSDGSLDASFNPGANATVYGLALQTDGRVLAGGDFFTFGGVSRSRVARCGTSEFPSESLAENGSAITWLRDGNAPEILRATFEVSTNLVNWDFLGEGVRISGGWQLTGLSLPPGCRIRARGYTAGGAFNSSTWFAETVTGPPSILAQPSGRTNNATTAVSLSVTPGGSPPFTYQWLKNDLPLADSGSISGAQTPTLRFTNLLGADSGSYTVIVSNTLGSVTSVVARLKVIDPVVLSSLYTNYVDAGDNVTVTLSAVGTPPLSYQWRKDGVGIPGATTTSLVLSNVQRADIGVYSATVSNSWGSTTSNRMALDVNLASVEGFLPGLDGAIYGMAEQPDGKIIISGNFTRVGNQYRPYLARLDPGGTLDPTFDPGTNISALIYSVSLQPDGKILIGGYFTLTQGSQTRYSFARLNSNGSLDASFDPQAGSTVLAIACQPDGKIVVGGWLTSLGGQPRSYVGRVHSNGNLDTNFYGTADYDVRCLALQPDGKILVAGGFNHLGSFWCGNIGRLNSDGTTDESFLLPGTYPNDPGANGEVSCLALQPDGKVVLGGQFTMLGDTSRKYIGRVNTNGTLDFSFNPVAEYYANGEIYSVALQADGKILVGGVFTGIGGKQRYYLARLLPGGGADPTFGAAIAHNQYVPVVSVGASTEGKTWVLGSFTSLDGESQTNLARLSATDPVTQSLTFDGAALTWLRNGPTPEISRATFETSPDGTNWTTLGNGTRIAGGWRLNGVGALVKPLVRAKGVAAGAYYSSSSWIVETTALVQPRILVGDGNFGFHTNCFGFTVAAFKGQSVVIDACASLPQWVPVQTNVVGDPGTFVFTDCTPGPGRFYRVRLAPTPAP